ncbi:MAG: NAD(P)-dependent oxidoreductase [Candidatus Micrarchaeota archaeon]|nr:NAD(P)-dependent oxidoreductase [Candidatus Micrarchaeota archaeon]
MSKILITGSSGRLGVELKRLFDDVLAPSSGELDITQEKMVDDYIKTHSPDVIIHLAAMTDIRKCDVKRALAWRINVEGTYNLIRSINKHAKGAYLIHMSTPCVFSGKEGNYLENSVPAPENFYGVTKMVAESLVRYSMLEKTLIIRANFVPKEKWPFPRAFTDRFGTYLFADQLASAIKEVMAEKLTGIVHVVGDKKISMFELAKITTPEVLPMTVSDYTGPNLTMDMSLDSSRWRKYKIGS